MEALIKNMKALMIVLSFAVQPVLGVVHSTEACGGQVEGFFSRTVVKGSKKYVTKEFKVEDFRKIAVAGSAEVEFVQSVGRTPKVVVTTSDNLMEHLDLTVRSNRLHVGWKRGVQVIGGKLKVTVTAPYIDDVSLAGSCDFDFTNGLKADMLDCSIAGSGSISGRGINCKRVSLSISGSGDVELEQLTTDEVEASISGSGDVALGGKAHSLEFSIAGSGKLEADKLVASDVEVSVSGSGTAYCHATNSLDVSIAGSGDVYYKGNPVVKGPKKRIHPLR